MRRHAGSKYPDWLKTILFFAFALIPVGIGALVSGHGSLGFGLIGTGLLGIAACGEYAAWMDKNENI